MAQITLSSAFEMQSGSLALPTKCPPLPRRGRWQGGALTEGVHIGIIQPADHPTSRTAGGTPPCVDRERCLSIFLSTSLTDAGA